MYESLQPAQSTDRQRQYSSEAEQFRLAAQARGTQSASRPVTRGVISAAGRGLVRVGEWMQAQAGDLPAAAEGVRPVLHADPGR